MNTYFSRIFLLLVLVLSYNTQAQNEEDALRYSFDEVSGSARFTGMSGAFSSLGGDMSAVGLNPAGLTTFSTNRISTALSFYGVDNNTKYFGNNSHRNYNSFEDNFLNFDQLGVAFIFKSDLSDWNKLGISFNYNKNVDYGNAYTIKGVNTSNHSVTDYFVNQAQGIRLGDIKLGNNETIDDVYDWLGTNIGYNSQQAFLGYQSYILNPVDDTNDDNVNYVANANLGQVHHLNKINTNGEKTNIDLTFAGTYQKHLQLGASLTLYSVDFTEHNAITETGYTSTSDLQLLKLSNTLRVEGNGVQLKLGGIYKFDNNLRLSFAYHTPQWIKIEEFMTQSIHSEFGNGDIVDVAPNVENSFAPYRIISPSKLITGASFVIAKKGLISVDYTYQDFSKLRFKEIDNDADTDYFDGVNEYMSTNFQPVHKFNIGGEVKLDQFSLRAGTFMSNSPYKSSTSLYVSKGYSAGFSYDFDGIVLDFAWLKSDFETNKTLLTLPDVANHTQTNNRFVLGVRYDF